MTRNIGAADRMIRLVAGIVLILLTLAINAITYGASRVGARFAG